LVEGCEKDGGVITLKFEKEASILSLDGELPLGLYKISQGMARLQKRNVILGRLGVGEIFGEVSLLDPGKHAIASIIAEEDNTEAICIPSSSLFRQFSEDPELGYRFFLSFIILLDPIFS
jgi:CRP-like cAMP-binding protein